jgi:endonuclease/exonuclease/phosphatase family metal-dependent hydrolase
VRGDEVDDAIRVVTWNLWWRFGDWKQRLDAIRDVLAEAEPDVCGLQEIWATAEDNSAELIAEYLGMHWAWVPSPCPGRWQQRLDAPGVDIGNAVLSRWPISDSAHIRLPSVDHDDEGRTILFAAIASPAGRIPFFTTQLNAAPGQSALRCRQVAAVAQFVATHGAAAFPPVLTGDFNAEPAADEIRLMEGHLTAPAVPGLVLADTWRYADPPDPGLTWNRVNPHVAASLEPSARIDYIFVGLPGRGGRGHVRSVRLIGDTQRGQVWPSDHAGVLADLHAGK